MTQAELARALGVSGAMVSKHKAQGMPVHSVAAARAWRAANLDPILVLRRELYQPAERPKPDRASATNELGRLAYADLQCENWRAFAQHVEELRSLLLPLTEVEEDGVRLPVEIWDALCGFPGLWLSAREH